MNIFNNQGMAYSQELQFVGFSKESKKQSREFNNKVKKKNGEHIFFDPHLESFESRLSKKEISFGKSSN